MTAKSPHELSNNFQQKTSKIISFISSTQQNYKISNKKSKMKLQEITKYQIKKTTKISTMSWLLVCRDSPFYKLLFSISFCISSRKKKIFSRQKNLSFVLVFKNFIYFNFFVSFGFVLERFFCVSFRCFLKNVAFLFETFFGVFFTRVLGREMENKFDFCWVRKWFEKCWFLLV